MSKTKWTPAQKTAIEHRGGSMLVSAAAGSGKTAVLVERVSLLLTDPVSHIDADKLLIVTFTNAAAAELRGRIAKSIESMIRETPRSDGKRLELLRRQKVRLQRIHLHHGCFLSVASAKKLCIAGYSAGFHNGRFCPAGAPARRIVGAGDGRKLP